MPHLLFGVWWIERIIFESQKNGSSYIHCNGINKVWGKLLYRHCLLILLFLAVYNADSNTIWHDKLLCKIHYSNWFASGLVEKLRYIHSASSWRSPLQSQAKCRFFLDNHEVVQIPKKLCFLKPTLVIWKTLQTFKRHLHLHHLMEFE